MTTSVDNEPNVENIYVLAAPVLPFSLHGKNPRNIMGPTAWNCIKKETQRSAANHCEVCGRHVPHVRGNWIETHEVYDIDHVNLIYRLARYIGLCHTCHLYVHLGRTQFLAVDGTISVDEYTRIVDHGERLLQLVGLTKQTIDVNAPYTLEWEPGA